MGLMDGISSAYNKVADTVSDAVDGAQETVSEAVDQVEEAVSTAADGVKDAASDVAEAVGKAANAVEEKAEAAAAWAQHTADGFALDLENRLNPDAARIKDEEGAISDAAASPATLPQDKPVDLESKESRAQFLAQWGQFDKDDAGTTTDASRCQSNTAMAALLLKGGPQELKNGLEKAQKEAEARAMAETDPDRKAMLEAAARQLGDTARKAGENKATPRDLDKAADALFKTFAEKQRIDAKSGKLAEGTGGMDAKGIEALERTLGLTPDNKYVTKSERSWIDPRGWGDSDQEEVTEQIWADLKPGQQAHVSVYGQSTYLAQGKGPHGEPIEKDWDGTPCFVDQELLKELRAKNAAAPIGQEDSEAILRKKATVRLEGGEANHAVLFGRTESGARYIYNPGGNPAYLHEDPRNPAEFDRKAAALVPKAGKDDYYAHVTPYT